METMKKITSVEQAIALFEKYAIKREGAIHCGNSKKANCYYDKNQNIVQYLREMKCLDALSIFMNIQIFLFALGLLVFCYLFMKRKV